MEMNLADFLMSIFQDGCMAHLHWWNGHGQWLILWDDRVLCRTTNKDIYSGRSGSRRKSTSTGYQASNQRPTTVNLPCLYNGIWSPTMLARSKSLRGRPSFGNSCNTTTFTLLDCKKQGLAMMKWLIRRISATYRQLQMAWVDANYGFQRPHLTWLQMISCYTSADNNFKLFMLTPSFWLWMEQFQDGRWPLRWHMHRTVAMEMMQYKPGGPDLDVTFTGLPTTDTFSYSLMPMHILPLMLHMLEILETPPPTPVESASINSYELVTYTCLRHIHVYILVATLHGRQTLATVSHVSTSLPSPCHWVKWQNHHLSMRIWTPVLLDLTTQQSNYKSVAYFLTSRQSSVQPNLTGKRSATLHVSSGLSSLATGRMCHGKPIPQPTQTLLRQSFTRDCRLAFLLLDDANAIRCNSANIHGMYFRNGHGYARHYLITEEHKTVYYFLLRGVLGAKGYIYSRLRPLPLLMRWRLPFYSRSIKHYTEAFNRPYDRTEHNTFAQFLQPWMMLPKRTCSKGYALSSLAKGARTLVNGPCNWSTWKMDSLRNRQKRQYAGGEGIMHKWKQDGMPQSKTCFGGRKILRLYHLWSFMISHHSWKWKDSYAVPALSVLWAWIAFLQNCYIWHRGSLHTIFGPGLLNKAWPCRNVSNTKEASWCRCGNAKALWQILLTTELFWYHPPFPRHSTMCTANVPWNMYMKQADQCRCLLICGRLCWLQHTLYGRTWVWQNGWATAHLHCFLTFLRRSTEWYANLRLGQITRMNTSLCSCADLDLKIFAYKTLLQWCRLLLHYMHWIALPFYMDMSSNSTRIHGSYSNTTLR